jgi:hypothetical protein
MQVMETIFQGHPKLKLYRWLPNFPSVSVHLHMILTELDRKTSSITNRFLSLTIRTRGEPA